MSILFCARYTGCIFKVVHCCFIENHTRYRVDKISKQFLFQDTISMNDAKILLILYNKNTELIK